MATKSNSKPWYQSTTIRVNGLVLLGAIASFATNYVATLPAGSNTAILATAAVSAANLILRKQTNQAITF